MLKKIFAFLPVFTLFFFLGLFSFASLSTSVFFSSTSAPVLQTTKEEREKIDQFWQKIKDELKKPEYANLAKILIRIEEKDYDLESLFIAAQNEVDVAGSELTTPGAKTKLQQLINENITYSVFQTALENRRKILNNFWLGIKDELQKPEYAYVQLAQYLIPIRKHSAEDGVSLEVLFKQKSDILEKDAVVKIWELLKLGISYSDVKTALHKAYVVILNFFWLNIKDELQKPEYTHLSQTPITIDGKEYSLEPLFIVAAKSLPTQEEQKVLVTKLLKLAQDKVTDQKLKDALDAKNNEKLDAFWSNIKDELKKPEYANLVKTQIRIGEKDYDLESLFIAAQNEVDVVGSKLKTPGAKTNLQQLINENITYSVFQTALENRRKILNDFWLGIKDMVQRLSYIHPVKDLISIRKNNVEHKVSLEILFQQKSDILEKDAVVKIWELVKLDLTSGNVFFVLFNAHRERSDILDTFWLGIKDELKKPKYAHLVNLPISIKGKLYNLELLFAAVSKELLEPEESEKLSELVQNKITSQQFKDALAKTALDLLWSGIKDELKKPEYAHLSKTPITIKEKEYDLELLYVAAKDDAQYRKEGSELPASEKDKLQELVNAKVVFSDLLDSLKLLNSKRLTVFQKLWTNQPSSFHYLLWLPLFNIQNLTVNQMDLTVGQLGSEVAGMLADQKLDFVSLSEKGKQELLSLLNEVGSLSEVVKTAVWKQVQNSEKWKKITDANSIATIMRIKKLLDEEVVELNIKKVDHPFFPQGYDLSFLQDVVTWKDTTLKQLLSGISIRIENNNVIFTSRLFPDQPVLKLPFNKIISVFDQLTLESIETALQTKVATKLDDYKSSIQINLKNFLQNDIFQIQFNKQNYSIENLIAETNLAKSGSELEGSARKELIYLFSGDLNSSILEDILEVRDSVQKKETDQSLLIVLTVVGTILGVSGIGVFFYFFTRR